MGFEILENHIALSASNNVKEICKPLEKLGVTYFSFVRSYRNGSHIRLSNNPAWTDHYYKRGFYNVVLKQVPDSEGNLLWSNIDKYPLFYEASEFYDVDNVPEEIIYEVASGCNANPSLMLSRKIIDLHRQVRGDWYDDVIKRICLQPVL